MIKRLSNNLTGIIEYFFPVVIIILVLLINQNEIGIYGVTQRLILLDIIAPLVLVLMVLLINRYQPVVWVDDDYIYFKTIFSRKDLVFKKEDIKKSGAILSLSGNWYFVSIEHNNKTHLFIIITSFFMSKEDVLNDLNAKIS